MLKLISVADAIEMITNKFGGKRTSIEKKPLQLAHGRGLGKDILAVEYIPNFDRATVDGYAIRSDDLISTSPAHPIELELKGQSKMGEHITARIKKGQCVYVPTGGEIPSGADAVVMIENTAQTIAGKIIFKQPIPADSNLIRRGEDMKPGDPVIPNGKRLKIADIGTLAAMGITAVPVRKQPRIGIISSGDELIPPDQAITRPGLIRDLNLPMLTQAVLSCGGIPISYGIIKDDQKLASRTIQKAVRENDLLIVTGGTSMDPRDIVQNVFNALGEIFIHGIKVKPGKPTMVASIKGKPAYGLPGNPVSAFFTFYLFVRPIILSMQGIFEKDPKLTLSLAQPVVNNHGREEYLPVIIKEDLAYPVASKSGLITTVSCADGFIIVPRDCERIEQGTVVEVTLLEK